MIDKPTPSCDRCFGHLLPSTSRIMSQSGDFCSRTFEHPVGRPSRHVARDEGQSVAGGNVTPAIPKSRPTGYLPWWWNW